MDDNEHGRNAPEYGRQNRIATVSAYIAWPTLGSRTVEV